MINRKNCNIAHEIPEELRAKESLAGTFLHKGPTGGSYVEVPREERDVILLLGEIEEIDKEIEEKISSQAYIVLKDKRSAEGTEFPLRHQKKLDELNNEISLLRQKKAELLLKKQRLDETATVDISPALEALAEGENVSEKTNNVIAEYKRVREAKGLPKLQPIAIKPRTSATEDYSKTEKVRHGNNVRAARKTGNIKGSGGSSSSDDGDSDSSDSGDPPRPGTRAHHHSPSVNHSKEKPRYLNRCVYRCRWRVSERGLAA